ncbi:MAG: ABC-F family ATP-binding cassette domain-containing protein [Methanobacteriota archaeon]|nr:MAG: ABC-F family ATP-binding cassette domain-containing protein [Euryarchaeota archaeon]
MEPIIAGRDLRKSWGSTIVLEHADFVIHAGEKVALVGPNGAGKSTLFRLIAGETTLDLGDLEMKEGLQYGYLPQVPNVPPETVVRDVLSAQSPEAQRIEAELAEVEAWMARPDAWESPDATARMARYETLHAALGTAVSRSDIVNDPILNDLGVSEELLDQRFDSLSGGEKSKVLTARALANAKEKDVLLLDEPTNHMDVDTIETIEEFLLEIDAALLLASHDKFLLDAVAHKVLEVDHLRILEYDGNYTDYRVQRDALARAREAQRNRHMKEMKRQLAIIEEFKARKVYEQVLSRKLLVEKMRRATPEPGPTEARAFRLAFKTGGSGHGIVRLEGIAKSHGGRLLFSDANLELGKGDKVGLVGPNGAGKTTLLEILIGQQEPDAGSVHRSRSLNVGYFAQEAEELDFSRTLLEEVMSIRKPPPPEGWARGLLGRFWFRGDSVYGRVGDLSGGERARLALAKFIAQEYDLLVLDEPTNHLDIESQEIVGAALKGYPGMVLVVSHNRSFLNDVCNKIAVIAHQRLAVFQGTFRDSWAAAKMAEFMAVKEKPRYRVLRVVKDWETGTAYRGGEVITLSGAETQAFLRLLRWAEAAGRVERLEA